MGRKLTTRDMYDSVERMLARHNIFVDPALVRFIVADVLDKLSVRPRGMVDALFDIRRMNRACRRDHSGKIKRLASKHTEQRLADIGGASSETEEGGDTDTLEGIEGESARDDVG